MIQITRLDIEIYQVIQNMRQYAIMTFQANICNLYNSVKAKFKERKQRSKDITTLTYPHVNLERKSKSIRM